MIKAKSVYAKPLQEDGRRILVDLFWPEGVKTREAKLDDWMVRLGPTYDLQRFNFDVGTWDKYKKMYEEEVMQTPEKRQLLESLAKVAKEQTVTLVYGNRDHQHNHANILLELIGKL